MEKALVCVDSVDFVNQVNQSWVLVPVPEVSIGEEAFDVVAFALVAPNTADQV